MSEPFRYYVSHDFVRKTSRFPPPRFVKVLLQVIKAVGLNWKD